MSYVPAIGPKDAKIVILGEAPGKNEASVGQPFVGKSGKLLTHLLAQAGILREQCYITNVVKERPPGNDISSYIDLKRKNPKVSDKGQHYLRLLEGELRKLNPNVIVPTGNVGLWALTGNRGITKWRGSIIADRLGRKVIPTVHPASALPYREYTNRYLILNDLKRVAFHKSFPEVPEDEREYLLRPGYDQSLEFLDRCKEEEYVAFDIEVSRGEVSCISFAYDNNTAISIPFTDHGREYFLLPQEAEIWQRIAYLLEDPSVRKIAHNATFDSTFLYRKYGIRITSIEDTMIAQGILYPDFAKSLAFCTSWYTNTPYYKDEGKQSFKAQDNEGFWLYNAKDSAVLMEMFPKMKEALDAQGNFGTYRSQCELIQPLLYMTELGFNMDVDSLRSKSSEYDSLIREKEILLNNEVGYKINPRSPQQLMDFFYEVQGHKPYKNRKTGRPTTNEKALKRLSRKGEKAASIILDIRELEKLKGTYFDVKLGKDNRLRGSFNPIGTVTLRLSSSKDIFGVGTNLQNLPPKMKANIVPDPGYCLIEIDLAQAENRVVAYIAPDDRMIEAFESGIDIHSKTAGLLFEMDPADIKQRYRQFNEDKSINDYLCAPIGQGSKPWRYWGKEANHAFNYGLGYKNAALRWEIPEKDAKFLRERYLSAYPGVKQMHRWIKDSLSKTRTVTNLFGWKRQFLGLWSNIVKEAYAFPAQSTVAEIINRWGVKYIYRRSDILPGVQLLGQVHDSIVFQVPLDAGWDNIHFYLQEITNSLEQPLSFRGRSFVIPAEVTLYPKNLQDGIELSDISAPSLEAAYDEATAVTA